MVTVHGSDQALTEVRGYRRAVVAQRVLAIAFLALLVASVATGLQQTLLYLCVAVGAVGAVLAWAVVAVLAVRLARRPGGHFDPTDLVPLATRYFHDLLRIRS